MKCQHCGKDIPNDSKTCKFCGKPVASGAWYKKWWIWLIAVIVVAAIVTLCVLAANGAFGGKDEPKEVTTTAPATVAVSTEAASTVPESTAAQKPTVDEIVSQGYEKTGITKLYNNIDKYKGSKILTAVLVKDLGDDLIYASVDKDGKVICFYRFILTDKAEIADVKKGEYAVIYGVVNPKGNVSGTIEVDESHVLLTGDEAKKVFDSIEDEKPVVPTTVPATTVPKTTAPVTTAPATTAPATTAPATTAPATTAPATTAPATTAPATTAPSDKVLYNENGVTVTYKGMEPTDFATMFVISVENKSGKDLYLGTQDSSVNGIPMEIIACEYLEKGKTSEGALYLLQSDLDDKKIEQVKEMKFKFILENPDDWDHPTISDTITLKL